MRQLTAAVGLALLAASRAQAAPCGAPDLLDMVPPDGAHGLPVDATLSAHYAASADYVNEEVVLVWPTGEEQVLPATFDGGGGLLTAVPKEPLRAGGSYVVRWPALRGLATATPGLGGSARFVVGDAADTEAPRFDGLTGLRWDLERAHNDCTDAIEERFLFDLALGTASDDGGTDGLRLLVFQTAGPHAAGMSIPVLTRGLPPDGAPVRVALPTGDAVGRICFAVLVRDTAGRISGGAERQVCADTPAPPFFRGMEGCAVAPGRGPLPAPALALLTAAAAVGFVMARRRRGAR